MPRLFRRLNHHVTMYGKPGCHLCDDARIILNTLGRRYHIHLDEVDIRSDPELFRRYDIRIPVLIVDGAIELEAPITERDVRRALRHGRRRANT